MNKEGYLKAKVSILNLVYIRVTILISVFNRY